MSSFQQRSEQARLARQQLQKVGQERQNHLAEGGSVDSWRHQLEDELGDFLDRLEYTEGEQEQLLADVAAQPDPIAELEGLVASLRTFDQLGDTERLRELLD